MKITPKFSFKDGKSVILDQFTFDSNILTHETTSLFLTKFVKLVNENRPLQFVDDTKEVNYVFSDVHSIEFLFSEPV